MRKKKDDRLVLSGKACQLRLPCSAAPLAEAMLELYEVFSPQSFQPEVACAGAFWPMARLVYSWFGQDAPSFSDKLVAARDFSSLSEKDVCLAFSGGLDSLFQAIQLQDAGYSVHLFFLDGANTYENGQAKKPVEEAAAALGMDLVQAKISKNFQKNNPWRQSWPENPLKNQLVYAAILDVCYERGWKLVSAGDDLNLGIADAVPGVNLTDGRELTESFWEAAKSIAPGSTFLPVAAGHEKLERLQKVFERGFRDVYYSCVQSGRFNQKLHKMAEEKYSVSLPARNCGCYCRKCAMHCLLLHYGKVEKYPEAFVEKCWRRLWDNAHSADYKFFSPDLCLEERISNLFSY